MQTLSTSRLDLRPWKRDDADFAFDLYSRWDVQQFIARTPRVMTDPAAAVALVERLGAFEDPVHGYWVVVPRALQRPAGTILLKPIPASGPLEPLQPSGDTEIGWHFHPDYWGHGYATEAASAVLQHAFDFGLPRSSPLPTLRTGDHRGSANGSVCGAWAGRTATTTWNANCLKARFPRPPQPPESLARGDTGALWAAPDRISEWLRLERHRSFEPFGGQPLQRGGRKLLTR